MKLVQIPGTQVFVNPEYVTSVFPAAASKLGQGCKSTVEYEGNAGYRTRMISSTATPEELSALLQGGSKGDA